jgi:general L-amino acid transport system ATP-binding protein
MNEPIIQFERVNKWFGQHLHVLRDIELDVQKGERIVVCGPSGSGKSTLIRCINALEGFQSGRLVVDGDELRAHAAGPDLKVIDQIRQKVGMVFQQFNLFPHLSVLDNLTLAPIQVAGMTPHAAQ